MRGLSRCGRGASSGALRRRRAGSIPGMTEPATRSFWGWGDEGSGPDATERDHLKMLLGARLGVSSFAELTPPRLEDLRLPPPRLAPPAALQGFVSQAPRDRAGHTYGKAYRDIVRGLSGDFAPAPDAVAYPRSEAEVEAVLAWCGERDLAAIPYGGGSSASGGVEARGLGE